jgi:hypothetical protein
MKKIAFILLLFTFSCDKAPEIIPDNSAPYYGEISTIIVRNYINRLYIDLIGREPLQVELDADIALLRKNNLSEASRKEIIFRLQRDSTVTPGDTSYKWNFYHRLYELYKVHFLEGASSFEIGMEVTDARNDFRRDSLAGNLAGMEEAQRRLDQLYALIQAEADFMRDSIAIDEICFRMVNNDVYDRINMNSFNFINASFNDLFHRFPTIAEYNQSYEMIEFNRSSTLFGIPGTNKDEYTRILTNSSEFYEGQTIWLYNTFMQREPSSGERLKHLNKLKSDKDLVRLQRELLSTDEYAGF